jgi:hypothetical protein
MIFFSSSFVHNWHQHKRAPSVYGLGYGLNDRSWVRVLEETIDFSLLHRIKSGSETNGIRGSLPGGKATVNWSLNASSSEAKITWSYTYTVPYVFKSW